MKEQKNILLLIFVCLPLFLTPTLIFSAEITPDQFTGSDGLLDEKELIEFFLVHDKKSFQDVWSQKPSSQEIANEGGNIEQAKKRLLIEPDLLEIESREGNKGPYTPQQIQRHLVNNQNADDKQPLQYQVTGLINKPLEKGNIKYGPIRLRQKFEDWSKKLSAVKGVSVSYSNDQIADTGTWLTQGSLTYPILQLNQRTRENRDQGGPNYTELALLPSIKWKYLDVSKGRDKDIEELTFQLPINYNVSHLIEPTLDSSGVPQGLASWTSAFYFSPFYLTDFDFDGELVGASLTYEPIVQIGTRFQTGSWHSLFETLDTAYLFRIIPGMNYNRVLSESLSIDRKKNDDMLAITTSLELGFQPFGETVPWEIRGTYDLLYDFTGEADGYSDKWSGIMTWWFTKNAALNLEYQKGDTVITKKKIDLITFGLNIRL